MSAASAAALAMTGHQANEKTDEYEMAVHLEGSRLYGLALSVLRDRVEAEDAVQDTMERAWRAWDQLKDPAKRGAWLATICVRRCLAIRARLYLLRREARFDADDGREVAAAATLVDPDLVQALEALSKKQRAVVALHYMYGYTLDESAEVMQCAPGTVRTHLARALSTLRERLSDA